MAYGIIKFLRLALYIFAAAGAFSLYRMTQNEEVELVSMLTSLIVGAIIIVLCIWGANALGKKLVRKGSATINLTTGEALDFSELVFTLNNKVANAVIKNHLKDEFSKDSQASIVSSLTPDSNVLLISVESKPKKKYIINTRIKYIEICFRS